MVLACAGLSYVAAVVSGYLAVVSPLFHTGSAAVEALGVAAVLAAVAAGVLALDVVLARRRPARAGIAAI